MKAFDFLHFTRGILYKDLKLRHVFVNKKDLSVQLIDFGMAEELDQYETTSMPGGTYHCMSPEMAKLFKSRLQKEEPDYSCLPSYESDLWSLGILAVEMASRTEVKPFHHLQPSVPLQDKIDYLTEIELFSPP